MESQACHAFILTTGDLERAWDQAVHRALITEHQGTLLGFPKPNRSHATGEVISHTDWTIWDRSTAAPARLVFDGAPIVRGAGLTVLPPAVTVHEGPLLDLDRVPDLMQRKELPLIAEALEQISGTPAMINLVRRGGVGKVIGVERVYAVLTDDYELHTPTGPRTIKELQADKAPKTRCQAPFRDSSSWAAFYNTHRDGSPFVYDAGTREKYTLRRDGNATMSEVIRTFVISEYQPDHLRDDGAVWSEALKRPIRLKDIWPTDELWDLMARASDAPVDRQGCVRRLALPAQFSAFGKSAWGEIVRSLPRQGQTMAPGTSDAETLEHQLSQLLHTLAVSAPSQSRHSLGRLGAHRGRLPPGRVAPGIPFQLWSRLTGNGLLIGLKPQLGHQVTPRSPLADLSAAELSQRCKNAGFCAPGDNRIRCDGEQLRITILSEEFVARLDLPMARDPDRAADLHAAMARGPRAPREGGGGQT